MNPFALTPEEISALWLSVKVSLCAVAGMILPGIALGWLLARRQFRGKLLVETLLFMPLVLPPTVTGYLLLLAFGRNAGLGRWLRDSLGLSVAFSWKGAAIASAVMSFPLLVQAIRLSIAHIDPRLEQAAGTLGAKPLGAFLTVTLPLAMPGILTGTILGFARSLGEFGATITFVGNIEGETRTLPLAFFTYAQTPGGEEPAFRLVLISLTVAFAALIGSEILTRRAEKWLNGE
jgi:molybdate transport system permease protein